MGEAARTGAAVPEDAPPRLLWAPRPLLQASRGPAAPRLPAASQSPPRRSRCGPPPRR